jgi:hypothetical protein
MGVSNNIDRLFSEQECGDQADWNRMMRVENDTYSLLYNIFADRELGLDLVPESVYTMQSKLYPTVFEEYGVPLDTRHTYTKGDWEIFCASVTGPKTKAKFIDTLANWVGTTPTSGPFSDLYDTVTGK